MKKKVLLSIIIFVSIVFFPCVIALEKTTIHGIIDPHSSIRLTLSYSANGISYENQIITKNTENSGYWEYKISTDPGVISLIVNYRDIQKEFTVSTGTEFEVDLNGEEVVSGISEDIEETTEDDETEEIIEGEVETESESTEQEEVAGITGEVISEEETTDSGVYFIAAILLVTVILANIISAVLIGATKKIGGRSKPYSKENIKVVKLSEKLAKIKERESKIKEEENRLSEQLSKVRGVSETPKIAPKLEPKSELIKERTEQTIPDLPIQPDNLE